MLAKYCIDSNVHQTLVPLIVLSDAVYACCHLYYCRCVCALHALACSVSSVCRCAQHAGAAYLCMSDASSKYCQLECVRCICAIDALVYCVDNVHQSLVPPRVHFAASSELSHVQ